MRAENARQPSALGQEPVESRRPKSTVSWAESWKRGAEHLAEKTLLFGLIHADVAHLLWSRDAQCTHPSTV